MVGIIGASCLLVGGSGSLYAQPAAKCVTVQDIRNKGGWDVVIQIPGYEPYWFADEKGNFQGMDYDLMVEVNKILNIPTTRYTTVPWAGVLPALQTGKSDLTPMAVGVTDARKKTFAFSYPEGDNSIVIMTRPDTGIKSTADLSGKVIAVETASAGEATALRQRDKFKAAGKDYANVKSYQHQLDMMLDLGNKRVDAVLSNVAPVTAYMKKNPGKFYNAGLVDVPMLASWAFRKEDMGGPDCIGTAVNRAIKTLREQGKIKALQLKWFTHEMPIPDYETWKSVD
jgi:polar amino acid transport system substrate-binding protein